LAILIQLFEEKGDECSSPFFWFGACVVFNKIE